jgi:hypothetical protein
VHIPRAPVRGVPGPSCRSVPGRSTHDQWLQVSDEGARAVSGFARRLRGSADTVEYQEDELFRVVLAEGGGERKSESLWERANSCLFATMGVAEER